MTAEDGESLERRLTKLESQADENRQKIANLESELDRLSADVQTARRPQWQLYLSALAFLAMLGGVAFTQVNLTVANAMAPMDLRVLANTNTGARLDASVATLETRVSETDRKVEVAAAERKQSLATAEAALNSHEQMIAFLFERAIGKPMPAPPRTWELMPSH